jgi:phage baseplate assembly protein W
MPTPIPTTQSWPLGGVDESGRLGWSSDERSVREVLLNILLTRPGERVQRPEFGAGLLNFVHQPNNETTRNLIGGVVRKSVQQWEPRILVEAVDVEPSPTRVADVHINIRYRMRFAQESAEVGFTLDLGEPA